MRTFFLPSVCFVVACAFIVSCGTGHAFIRTELYFGLSRPDSSIISQSEWDQFVAQQITPRFPDGITVVNAQGQYRYRATGQIVQEPSRIVMFLYPPSPAAESAIDSIEASYKTLFHQESVLKVTSSVNATFD